MFVCGENDLNEEQETAIYEKNNVFLIACPGSGKTRTITYKIAFELSNLNNHKKWIVAITYTRRAANEIRERIEMLGVDTSQLWIGTIHAFCLEWILKPYSIYHDRLKYSFRIINSYDSEKIISNLCLKLKFKKINYFDCGYYYTPQGLKLTSRNPSTAKEIKEIIDSYHKELEEKKLIDFEQILYFSYEILIKNCSVAKILSKLFGYILIDEYQDTKEIQYSIIANIIRASQGKLKTFIVGDPNQAIFGSLGGYAINLMELEKLSEVKFTQMTLNKNYRSSAKIINYFSNYSVIQRAIVAEGENKEHKSIITYEFTHKNELVEQISRYIEYSINELTISEKEICVIAPWWIHLATLTRKLVNRLPLYSFDGPGLVPFSRDIDNFWFKLTQIILTEPSPNMYVKRVRWASDVISDMQFALIDTHLITPKSLLKIINSITVEDENGLDYLRSFFNELFKMFNIDFTLYPMLKEHYDAFFNSSHDRIKRLSSDNENFVADINTFKKAFKPRNGIKISTIHGVKGGEYDVVIAFGLLQGIVPHFNDNNVDNAKKLLYVIGSRARKNLHLISETERMKGKGKKYQPTEILHWLPYQYDKCPF